MNRYFPLQVFGLQKVLLRVKSLLSYWIELTSHFNPPIEVCISESRGGVELFRGKWWGVSTKPLTDCCCGELFIRTGILLVDDWASTLQNSGVLRLTAVAVSA